VLGAAAQKEKGLPRGAVGPADFFSSAHESAWLGQRRRARRSSVLGESVRLFPVPNHL